MIRIARAPQLRLQQQRSEHQRMSGGLCLYRQRDVRDGLRLYRSTDQVTDALAGVTLTLEGTGTETAEFTIGPDAGGVEGNVRAFLEKYNSVICFVLSGKEHGRPSGS